ncbi:endonuclease/exonuclease/phosphatase family protein [Roseomonas chloroacetimidivorans]|uniref:endonuclease/exonuclease/phosphatase family protein n=1 Tax=Roseomonas chloroacetimidivorans TaxID=1766656 RepID=UPI003C75079D
MPRVLAEIRGRFSSPVHDPVPIPDGALTVASYNVHKCVGTDKRFDPARVAEVIAELDADILALQEADRRFGRRVGLLDMAEIERRTGLRLVPLSTTPGGHGWHGNALLLREGQVTRLHRMALPGGEPRGAVMVEMELQAGPLRVIAAHFGLLRRHRAQQVAAILSALAQHDDMPTIMLGDLNEWRPGRRSSLRALAGPFGHAHPGPATFPSRLPILPLDRIFGRPHGLVRALQAHDTPLSRIASDHLPLKGRLDLVGAAAHGVTAVSMAA